MKLADLSCLSSTSRSFHNLRVSLVIISQPLKRDTSFEYFDYQIIAWKIITFTGLSCKEKVRLGDVRVEMVQTARNLALTRLKNPADPCFIHPYPICLNILATLVLIGVWLWSTPSPSSSIRCMMTGSGNLLVCRVSVTSTLLPTMRSLAADRKSALGEGATRYDDRNEGEEGIVI